MGEPLTAWVRSVDGLLRERMEMASELLKARIGMIASRQVHGRWTLFSFSQRDDVRIRGHAKKSRILIASTPDFRS